MTRIAIDALTAVQLVQPNVRVADAHQLVAPNLLRSEALSLIYRAVQTGKIERADAPTVLDGITTMKIRLLGDRVSRATAWKIAEQLSLPDTTQAEYLAVAKLQADVLVTIDPTLARLADGIIEVAPFETLLRG